MSQCFQVAMFSRGETPADDEIERIADEARRLFALG
jgi:hypothetical protein